MAASGSSALTIVGVDVGGTFTDFVSVRGGAGGIASEGEGLVALKLLSSPADPAQPVVAGVHRLVGSHPAAAQVIHGSTLATNALLERRGARTALITTAGFEDVLEIGRQNRPELYNLDVSRPPPLVPRRLRFGAKERVGPGGEVIQPLSPAEAKAVVRRVAAAKPESLAICLLFSFAHPGHEEMLKRAAEELLCIPIALSSELLPEFREYERCSTTVANAYLAPLVGRYLESLSRKLGPVHLRVMQSNGGAISPQRAAREPVRTVLSGPAGGAMGACAVARQCGFGRLITLDMGGTSTDVSLSTGRPSLRAETVIAQVPIRVPVVDIHTIGAGGGSIAWVDAGGALRVGPQSAGAEPGPACYGRGDEPTVTDAHLVLGRLGPEPKLAGTMPLDFDQAERALQPLAGKLGLDALSCAAGILQVANVAMQRAIRVISVERGHDPRDLVLLAFGGAGPLHAWELAAGMGIPRVLVPRLAGVLSAYGLAVSDAVRDYSRTLMLKLGEGSRKQASAVLGELQDQALHEMSTEGFAAEEVTLERSLDMRYVGQSHELTVPFGPDVRRTFYQAHLAAYGYNQPGRAVEVVTVRLRAVGNAARPQLQQVVGSGGPAPAPETKGPLWHDGRLVEEVAVWRREQFRPGDWCQGPAVVVEDLCTTYVPLAVHCRTDAWGNLVLEAKAGQDGAGAGGVA